MFRVAGSATAVVGAMRGVSAAVRRSSIKSSRGGGLGKRRRVLLGVGAVFGVGAAKVGHAIWPVLVPLERKDANDGGTVFRPTEGFDRLIRDVFVAGLIAMEYIKRGPEGRAEAHEAAADWMLKLCRVNRGIYVKLGQHICQLEHLLPQAYTTRMRPMLHEAPLSSMSLVEQVLEEELGPDWRTIFRSFEDTPIASASLAQVHRATLHDGTQVAVKVQHKGLRETCATDIVVIHRLLTAAAYLWPKFDYVWLSEEMARNLPHELDFRAEGRNSEKTAANFVDTDSVVVPAIHWEHTRSRVLVMDWEEGCYIDDVAAIREQSLEPASVAKLLSWCFSRQIFRDGWVHCDPHAGNVLIRPKKTQDGKATREAQLVLLDHGLYRDLEDDFRMTYLKLWNAIIFADLDGIKKASEEFGVVEMYPLLAAALTAQTWDKISDSSIDSLRLTGGTEEKERLSSSVAQYADEIAELLRLVPRDLLLLFKANDCLRSVDLALGAPVNTHIVMARECARCIAKQQAEDAGDTWWSRLWASWYVFQVETRLSGLSALVWWKGDARSRE